MENSNIDWVELPQSRLENLWGKVHGDLSFSPYTPTKIGQSSLTIDLNVLLSWTDRVSWGEIIGQMICQIFDQIRDDGRVILLNWHHPSFEFFGGKFQFPCKFDFPPNGDYLFFYLEKVECWLFCDGIDDKIYVFGDVMKIAFEEELKNLARDA